MERNIPYMNNMGGILPTLPMSVRGQGVGSLSTLPILVKGQGVRRQGVNVPSLEVFKVRL